MRCILEVFFFTVAFKRKLMFWNQKDHIFCFEISHMLLVPVCLCVPQKIKKNKKKGSTTHFFCGWCVFWVNTKCTMCNKHTITMPLGYFKKYSLGKNIPKRITPKCVTIKVTHQLFVSYMNSLAIDVKAKNKKNVFSNKKKQNKLELRSQIELCSTNLISQNSK